MSSLRSTFLRAVLAALLCTTEASNASAEDRPIEDVTKPIPEMFVQTSAHCAARFDIKEGGIANRRKQITDFVAKAYVDTEKWHHDYVVFAIDYVEFSYFHVITGENCEESADRFQSIARSFSSCRPIDGECKGGLGFSIEPSSPLVVRWEGGSGPYEIPVTMFERYHGLERLPYCTVKFRAKPPADTSPLFILETLELPWRKYRMPLLDVWLSNNSHYLVFARQCDKKRQLFESFVWLFAQEGYNWRQYFGEPDFDPDVADYVFSQTGRELPARK